MSAQDSQTTGRSSTGPLAKEISVVRRYVQSHTKLAGYNREPKPSWDGIGITWFDSVDKMRTSIGTPEYEFHSRRRCKLYRNNLPKSHANPRTLYYRVTSGH
jgi:hypothetical protein